MTAAVPTVHQACWPMSSYSARDPDPGSLASNLLESHVRFQFRDRRPRCCPGSIAGRRRQNVTPRLPVGGQWHPSSRSGPSMVGRTRAPKRDARTRCQDAPLGGAVASVLGTLLVHDVPRCPARPVVARGRCSACRLPARRPRRRSFDPTGACTADGSRARRLPGPRGPRPDDVPGRRPGTRRFRAQLLRPRTSASCAGRHRRGPLRRRDLVVRGRAGRRARGLHGARPDGRRPGRPSTRERPDGEPDPDHVVTIADRSPAAPATGSTPRPGSGLQTVVVWPSAEPDLVNVVITNDLPDAADPGRDRRLRRQPSSVLESRP